MPTTMKIRQKCKKQKTGKRRNSEKKEVCFSEYAFKDFRRVQYTPILDSAEKGVKCPDEFRDQVQPHLTSNSRSDEFMGGAALRKL